MDSRGIVLSEPDKKMEALAKQHGLPVTVDADLPLAYDKTLFVASGTTVPWDLLPAAWHFLQRWDAAVPLWRYGVNACDVGGKEEQQRTKEVVRDLRVLLHSYELLFVRKNAAGRALRDAFLEELQDSEDPRLAFLRAFYRVKPRLCVLPRSWLAEVQQYSGARSPSPPRKHPTLVQVQIGPGRYVRCRPENVEKVREQFAPGRRHA